MFALSVFLLFIHVLHHIVQCWSVWCGDVLQRCILSGAKMCTEVVRPRVCCQDYQHQEAVGERWVDTIWVLTGTSSGKRQHVSKVPVLTVLYRPTKDTEAFYCIYFVLGLDMQTKKCWVQDLLKKTVLLQKHLRSGMQSLKWCAVTVSVHLSGSGFWFQPVFLVVPVVDARQTATVVGVNKSVDEMVSWLTCVSCDHNDM